VNRDGSAADWHEQLAPGLAGTPIARLIVLERAESTQDEAFAAAAHAGPGVAVTTLEQTRGRGRLGRAWSDSTANIALSIALAAEPDHTRGWRLPIAAGVTLAEAASLHTKAPLTLRWPNDLIAAASGRKLGGVLIETRGSVTCVGIGLNALTRDFPQPIADHAQSLAELGCAAGRVTLLESLLARFASTLARDDESLIEAWKSREHLLGRSAAFAMGPTQIRGIVRDLDPRGQIIIQTPDQTEVAVPAAAASLIEIDGTPR
jgi:BirA family biotin operon repressor/biotin-[acetyl-CoA-carboxylase] ligase